MTIEGGARAGLIAPDEKIFKYLEGKPMSPKGEKWDKALAYWRSLKSDDGANFDKLKLRYYAPDYRGVHAARDIKKGETIVYVPLQEIITLEMAMECPIGA